MEHHYDWILHLGVILLAAKIGAELFQRWGMSAVIGEIVIGVLLGHSMLNIIPESKLIVHLAELGVVFLIFLLGLETKVQHLMEVGVTASLVALGGLLVPLAMGYGMGHMMGLEWKVSIFLGALLMATSVAISTRVFLDCGMGRSRVTQTIIAAAVIDDIVGLIILTLVLAMTGGGDGNVGLYMGLQAVFLFVVFPVSLFVIPKLVSWVRRLEGEGALFTIVLGTTLLFAYLGVLIKMEPIIGAFLIGVVFGSTKDSQAIEHQVTSLVHFLAPIFFVHVGLMIDVQALSSGIGFAIVLTVVAAISKIVGCGAFAMARGMSKSESMLVGVGMIPRGEVGLIIAGIGLAQGIFDDAMYSATALMCVLTILIVPPMLKPMAKKMAARQEAGLDV